MNQKRARALRHAGKDRKRSGEQVSITTPSDRPRRRAWRRLERSLTDYPGSQHWLAQVLRERRERLVAEVIAKRAAKQNSMKGGT
jgi:hypothetical protein